MALDFPTERFARNGDGSSKPVAVLGGGPAGLTAGYLLARQGRRKVQSLMEELIDDWFRRENAPRLVK